MVHKRAARTAPVAPPTGSPIGVAAVRTGIAEETLRAWERRYGFPKPARRAGGSRLYSEADIDKLQLLGRAIAAGFRPGDVVRLPEDELRRITDSAVRDAGEHRRAPARSGQDAVGRIMEALRDDDAAEVASLLRESAAALGPKDFVIECAHPLIVRVGAAWAEGLLDVRHEHLASAYLQTELRSMLAQCREQARARVVLLTTLPEEPHSLPLDLVAVYLGSLGAAPRLLGASTPADQIAAAAVALRADAVGISVSSEAPRSSTQQELRALRAALPAHVHLWVGGSGARTTAPTTLHVRVVDSWPRIDDALRTLDA